MSNVPIPFPIGSTSDLYIVAPLWKNFDSFITILYKVHSLNDGNADSEALLTTVSGYITSGSDVIDFRGSWMVIATWLGVAEGDGREVRQTTFTNLH